MEFKKQNLFWAVGASLLLKFKGIVDDFNDIDIVIDSDDFEAADKILREIASETITKSNPKYDSRYFKTYIIDGVEIDVMSEYKVHYDDEVYLFDFNRDYLLDYKLVNNIEIPLCRVEDWYSLYKVMEKDKKVKKIKKNYVIDKEYERKVIKLEKSID